MKISIAAAATLLLSISPTLIAHTGSVRRRRLQVTASQLAAANSAEKCYLQIDSDVYDVTAYASMHPVGPDSIFKNCGTDTTDKFFAVSSHSAALLGLATNLGPLVPDPVPETPAPIVPTTPSPVVPATPAPVEPATPAPVEPATPAPVEAIPVTTQAVPIPVTTPAVPQNPIVATPGVPVTNPLPVTPGIPVTTPATPMNYNSEESSESNESESGSGSGSESSESEDSEDSEDSVEEEWN